LFHVGENQELFFLTTDSNSLEFSEVDLTAIKADPDHTVHPIPIKAARYTISMLNS
jgi:hypothetical protein